MTIEYAHVVCAYIYTRPYVFMFMYDSISISLARTLFIAHSWSTSLWWQSRVDSPKLWSNSKYFFKLSNRWWNLISLFSRSHLFLGRILRHLMQKCCWSVIVTLFVASMTIYKEQVEIEWKWTYFEYTYELNSWLVVLWSVVSLTFISHTYIHTYIHTYS